jgi:hypothetical protein
MTAEHNMAASSILFSELWDSIERGGGKIVAAFPNRNTALYVRLNLPNAVSVMKKAIAKDEFSGADELSKMLYCRVNGRWCLFEL